MNVKKKLAAFLAMMMALVTMSSAAMAEEETGTGDSGDGLE